MSTSSSAVVVERQSSGEPGGQAGVGTDEALHLVGVAGDDDDHLVAVVLHQLDQRRDGLLTEVVAPPVGDQRVRLVDEQHAAQGTAERGLRLRRGMPDVLTDQGAPVDLDQMPGVEHAQRPKDLPVQPGHGGLAGAGVAGEDQVPGHRRGSRPASKRAAAPFASA